MISAIRRAVRAFFRISGAIAVLAFLASPASFGQTVPDDEVTGKLLRQNFYGWDGIVMFCLPEGKSDVPKRICSELGKEADYLTTSLKIKLLHATDVTNYARLVLFPRDFGLESPLSLTIRILGVQNGGMLAIATKMQAGTFAEYVASRSKRIAEARPKTGTLQIWDRHQIFNAPPNQMVSYASQTSRDELRDFFTLYAKYNISSGPPTN